MEAGFQQTVKTTAALVHQDNGEPSTRDPESGVYNVDMREISISDSKTSNILYSGFVSPSVLTVQVTRDVEANGWSIQGTRKTTGRDFFIISEGFVAPSGKAYWVETTRSNYQSILVAGVFRGEEFTDMEWLSSKGDRGRYTEFRQAKEVEADTAILLNSEASTSNNSKSPEQPLILWL